MTTLMSSMFLFAQTTSTTISIETDRPLTDFVVDVLNLEEGSMTAGLLGWIIEPLLQVVLILILAWLASRFLRRMVRRVVRRLKDNPRSGPLGFGDSPGAVSTRRSQ